MVVSDRAAGWTHNYRIPDVAVFLRGTSARSLGTHWLGGPDFVVEVVSPEDNSRAKLGFYAKVGTRELLVIDRDPWGLELYRLADGVLASVGVVGPEPPGRPASAVLPLGFGLIAGEERPGVEVVHEDGRRWVA
jgi:Uma2 family endonuclease